MGKERLVFIAGPTASGKSAAALALAQAIGGEIVNADAMQVYKDLRIITARPTAEDEAKTPHHLYGVFDGAELGSAGRWAALAVKTIEEIWSRDKTPILAGGTGLYFKALEDGLSPIPETPPEFREQAKKRHEDLGAAAFREEVVGRDPAMGHLPENDTQRLQRAWEVFEATGKPLSYFQSLPREKPIEAPIAKALIIPPREKLYAQCDARAAVMFSEGGVEEVRALLARKLDPSLPVMKALGVPEIADYLSGAVTRQEALAALQQNTRRFAKRQMTWFRNQAPDWPVFENSESAIHALS